MLTVRSSAVKAALPGVIPLRNGIDNAAASISQVAEEVPEGDSA